MYVQTVQCHTQMYSHMHTYKKVKAKTKAFWLPLSDHAYPVTGTGTPVSYPGAVCKHWQILLGQD